MKSKSANDPLRVLSLCDGMSCGYITLAEMGLRPGLDFLYDAVEINFESRKLSDHNCPEINRQAKDIARLGTIELLESLPVYDLVLFGFSCKKLSSQSTSRDLVGDSQFTFEECMRILALAKFKNPHCHFMIENVASMKNKVKDRLSTMIGGYVYKINSKFFSGQARNRIYWTSFPIWKSILENQIDVSGNDCLESGKLKAWSKSTRYLDENGRQLPGPTGSVEKYIEDRLRTDGKANTLVTGDGCQGQSSKNTVIEDDGTERLLTVNECAKLQGIPDWYDMSIVTDGIGYRCLGDGWNVSTIEFILSNLIDSDGKILNDIENRQEL